MGIWSKLGELLPWVQVIKEIGEVEREMEEDVKRLAVLDKRFEGMSSRQAVRQIKADLKKREEFKGMSSDQAIRQLKANLKKREEEKAKLNNQMNKKK